MGNDNSGVTGGFCELASVTGFHFNSTAGKTARTVVINTSGEGETKDEEDDQGGRGKREEVTGKVFCEFAKKISKKGATILGGCCETDSSHIKELSKLK